MFRRAEGRGYGNRGQGMSLEIRQRRRQLVREVECALYMCYFLVHDVEIKHTLGKCGNIARNMIFKAGTCINKNPLFFSSRRISYI